ncbi:MAG: CopG family transcriptional regulator [Betaproteobacteria bacterium]|nr:CopG family transcriptional regulator [Betaproteobacteria bacterium]
MATIPTSLKMPEDLKKRIARLADQTGESTHALTLRLLAERVAAAERRQRFHDDGRAAVAAMQASGEGYAAADVHRYLDARVAGKPARRPRPVRWRG